MFEKEKKCNTLNTHQHADIMQRLACLCLITFVLPPAQILEGSAARISMQDFLRI